MKIHLLVLEFLAFYLHGVQLVSLIVLRIGSPNPCFVNKVNELDESVPMDVDRVIVVRLKMTWRLTMISWRSTMICRILWGDS